MKPASEPRSDRDSTRLLVLDPRSSARIDARMAELPRFLRAGDLLVVNDAATLPASLPASSEAGDTIELRLLCATERGFTAVVFGAGDYHTRTEDRAAPPELRVDDSLCIGARLHARVVWISPLSKRLIELRFDLDGAPLWAELYALGTPVQYSHQAHALPLWSVQTAYAARPWAAEMPSAGRPLSFATLLALKRKGVRIATLTHAAGLSATGDPKLDAALPLPERYDIPSETVVAVADTLARSASVVAVGTSVVRALEGAWRNHAGQVRAGTGLTDLHIGPTFEPRVVTGLLTGMHNPAESHYALLRAFASEPVLRAGFKHAQAMGYLSHEFGDTCLITPPVPV